MAPAPPLLVTLIASTLCACSRGDCRAPQSDVDPARLARWMASEFGVPSDVKDVQIGTGRLAQVDRRLSLHLSFTLPDGSEIGGGPFTLEYPQLEANARQIRQRNVPTLTKLFAAVAGMREGGEREFTWRSSLQRPAECQPRQGRCELWLDGQRVEYPPDTDITVRAHLDRICAPTYCVHVEYAIPKSVNYRLVERSCR